jgi:hypothetical protein
VNSDSERGFPWSELGLAPTRDIAEIQRAYARCLKTIDLASERDAFQALRRAYEAALVAAASGAEPEPVTVEEGPALEPPPAPPPPPVRTEPSTQVSTVELARLRAFLEEFAAQGKARDVTGAMAELDRFLRAAPLLIEAQGEMEVRLFGIVMDDPDMPVELLTELAKRFRWTEIGSGLELTRPDLYARFLYRQSSAHEWLQRVQALRASGPRQGWLQRSRLLGLGAATPAYAAYLVLARYDWRFAVFGVFYDPNALDTLLRQARRFGPLLGDVLDPRMIEFLWRHSKRLKANRGSVRKVIVVMASISVAILGLAYIADYTGVIGRWQTPSVSTAVLPTVPVTYDAVEEIKKRPEDWVSITRQTHSTAIYFGILFTEPPIVTEIRYGVDTPMPDRVLDLPSPNGSANPLGRKSWSEVEAPTSTRYVSLQVRFKDSTLSAIQTYTVPPE